MSEHNRSILIVIEESPSLTLPRVILIIGVTAITFFLLTAFVFGSIGAWFNLDKFALWYYNALVPLIATGVTVTIGRIIARRQAGAWIAAVTLLVVFGGMNLFFQNLDPTDQPLVSLLFMGIGVGFSLLTPRLVIPKTPQRI